MNSRSKRSGNVRLSAAARRELPASEYALPQRRQLPLTDAGHVHAARSRLEMMLNLGHVTKMEYEAAVSRIKRAAKRFGVQLFYGNYKPMDAYEVFLNGKLIDIVFYTPGMDSDSVRRGLIGRNGFDPRINVRRRRAHGSYYDREGLTNYTIVIRGQIRGSTWAKSPDEAEKKWYRTNVMSHEKLSDIKAVSRFRA